MVFSPLLRGLYYIWHSQNLKRIESLKYEDIKDDFKHFQDNKNLELRNFEYDKYIFNLDNIKFVTSTKTNEDIRDFYLLNDLSEYLISDEEIEKKRKKRKRNRKKL